MILVDTGPLIALFEPKDHAHERCRAALHEIREPLTTTIPVLTEAFHMLSPDSIGSDKLREFISKGGLGVWFFDQNAVERAFELMDQYRDHPMDLADASLVTAAEDLETLKVFTLDRRDFDAYRIRRGHRHIAPPELLPA